MITRSVARSLIVSTVLLAAPIAAHAQYGVVGVSVNLAPPPLPVYAQPEWPGDGYEWTPGYWAYADAAGYYWVPGTWVLAPAPGLLWTPGYWAWEREGYLWNAGYWGPHVGFYGGINYGFGYFGSGYSGGYWANDRFFCNGAVTNVGRFGGSHGDVYYGRGGAYDANPNRASYNGGAGGTRFHSTAADLTAAREPHIGWTTAQRQHADMARSDPALAAAANHGAPPVAATPRVGLFNDRRIAVAHGSGNGEASHVAVQYHGRNAAQDAGTMSATQHYPSQGVRSDRPSWANGQPGRSAAVAGGGYPSGYPAMGGDSFQPSYLAAPTPGTRTPGAGPQHNGYSTSGARRQTPEYSSGGADPYGGNRWSGGGYASGLRVAPSRSYLAASPAQQRGPAARASAGANRGYGAGSSPRYGSGGAVRAPSAAAGHRR